MYREMKGKATSELINSGKSNSPYTHRIKVWNFTWHIENNINGIPEVVTVSTGMMLFNWFISSVRVFPVE